MLNSGPPELPLLMAASVWMKLSYGPCWMSRPRAQTMPAVTVPPRPNGLPIASTQSPTRERSESPNVHCRQRLVRRTFSTAMSVRSSRPIRVAFSAGVVLQRDGDFVGAVDDVVVGHHDAGRIDDEAGAEALHLARRRLLAPLAVRPRWLRSMKSLKNCSNGEPGGNMRQFRPAAGRSARLTVWLDEMLTTPGSSLPRGRRNCPAPGAPGAAAGARRQRRGRQRQQHGTARHGQSGRVSASAGSQWQGVRQKLATPGRRQRAAAAGLSWRGGRCGSRGRRRPRLAPGVASRRAWLQQLQEIVARRQHQPRSAGGEGLAIGLQRPPDLKKCGSRWNASA